MSSEYTVHLPTPHAKQAPFIDSTAKRNIVRAGRRSGKTVGVATRHVQRFLAGRRVLYTTPTADQLGRWWTTITRALAEPVQAGVFYKNETEHLIELKGTEQRIRGKTAWSPDTLRGDYADDLTFDEWQLMDESTWDEVGAPMLLDKDGDATFIYTPPSLHSRSISKARDPQHAAKMFKKAQEDTSGRWAAFGFTSHDNPYISKDALAEITKDMTTLAYRMEILAQDVNEAPGALWTRKILDDNRVVSVAQYERVIVAVDPSTTTSGDECGIITAGRTSGHFYPFADDSLQGSPKAWATAAVTAYHKYHANCIVAESNQGGEMVELTIHTVDPHVPVKLVHASRGKQTRAEPIAAIFEQGRGHMVGSFPELEDELCLWIPGDASPNHLDAMVWAGTELMLKPELHPAGSHQG